MSHPPQLVRVTGETLDGRDFCAGIIFAQSGRPWRAAPILAWAVRKAIPLPAFQRFAAKASWQLEFLS